MEIFAWYSFGCFGIAKKYSFTDFKLGHYPEAIPLERKDLLDMIIDEGQDLAQSHRQKKMTNTSWWGTYNALASQVLLGRRKGCSGSNLLSYFF